MRTRRHATIRDLRLAIDCLPTSTRIAMLEGIRSNEIIVGAYTDGGGVCPMLAAHRAGGRTSFIQRTHLEASLLDDELASRDLAGAVAEHRELLARRGRRSRPVDVAAERPRPGDRDRSRELNGRHGWASMRVFRGFEDYERALDRLQSQHEALDPRRERELVS
jgi:hypothetical protein